ncbi:MAG TPA: DNA topoisomerase VI subunit B [Candidatus Thermoplasmatota archaeon]|jgi:DNA topoisomerase-6 subunit B|nr:DNA topoisomerase VI subunit B [Candidatus Thermoplasmatota archaeon]
MPQGTIMPPSQPIAEELAKKQREISVSEFFERNKHILGYDSSVRSLITVVKEAVDNALDACEEAGVLPDVAVEVAKASDDEFRIGVEDNGPGIVKAQIPNIFGRLLYGSRFHAIRQTRGAQGIGISAAVMYSNLTTGKPAKILTKIAPEHPAYDCELIIDTKKNRAEMLKQAPTHWDKDHGTKVTLHLEGKYQRGGQSIFEYVRNTAIVNPHARISLKEPDGTTTTFERATDKLPAPTVEIKPHPEGIELGTLLKMAKHTESTKMTSFLTNDFVRVGYTSARGILDKAKVEEKLDPHDLSLDQAKEMLKAFRTARLMAPPTDCLSPIGETLIKKGLKKEMPDAEFIVTVTRPPSVYSGNPFQVEAGVVYGGKAFNPEEPVKILRFSNRVPLLYQKGDCASTAAVEGIDWRRYGLEQRGGKGIPYGPAAILVHVCSTNVPYTSEAKEAIAHVEPIENEIQLALRDCGRRMNAHIHKQKKYARMREKMEIIRKILPKIAEKSASIVGKPVPDIEPIIARIMNNVLIDSEITYVQADKKHKVALTVKNYTTTGKGFELISEFPAGAKVGPMEPKGKVDGQRIVWDLKRIPAGESRKIAYELLGLDQEAYDETELLVKGIDEELVIGAEAIEEKPPEGEQERITEVKA